MLFSRIKSLGRSFDVFPVSNMPNEPSRYRDNTGSAATVFLLPSIECDIRVAAFDEDGTAARSYLAPALAATTFLLSVRGLPLDEISVETEKRNYEIKRQGNVGKCHIEAPKCKLLCSNMPKNIKNTTIYFSDISICNKQIRVVNCDNLHTFSDENMPPLLLDDLHGTADVVAVTTLSDTTAAVKSYSAIAQINDYLYSAIAANYLYSRNEALTVISSGKEIEFMKKGGTTFLSSPFSPPMTFIAPDILT